MKMELGQEIEQHQVLEYDLKAEQALRREVYGPPPLAYRDPALLEPVDDTVYPEGSYPAGCYHTKPAYRSGHG